MQAQLTSSAQPYLFVDGVWFDPAGERISHLHGQFMNVWNARDYKPHVFDADVTLDVLEHSDNIVLLEEEAPGKLRPGPVFRSRTDATGRPSLYMPDRPLDALPLF